MKKSLMYTVLAMALVIFSAPLVMAAPETAQATGGVVDYTKAIIIGCSLLIAGLAIGLGTIGTGIGMGNAINGATNAVGRNPEAQGKILITMIVGVAMIESLAIYALVVSLIAFFANPFLVYIG